MAKTFEAIKEVAVTIKENTLPDSNTANLVGGELVDIIDKVQEVDTNSKTIVNELNIDNLYPLSSGYYTLTTAISAVTDDTLKKSGVKIIFKESSNNWVKYQFIGSDISSWTTIANWQSQNVVQEKGDSTSAVMSQKAVSDLITSQLFNGPVFTNPFTANIIPRRIGDTAINSTTLEIWGSTSLSNSIDSWVRKSAGKFGGTLITDFNAPNLSGINTALNTALNAPNDTENWYCLHMNSNNGVVFAVQIAVGFTTGKIYQRLKINSVYGSWELRRKNIETINVNAYANNLSGTYTKITARSAIAQSDRRAGMILLYRTASNTWKCQQWLGYTDKVTDQYWVNDESYWQDIYNSNEIDSILIPYKKITMFAPSSASLSSSQAKLLDCVVDCEFAVKDEYQKHDFGIIALTHIYPSSVLKYGLWIKDYTTGTTLNTENGGSVMCFIENSYNSGELPNLYTFYKKTDNYAIKITVNFAKMQSYFGTNVANYGQKLIVYPELLSKFNLISNDLNTISNEIDNNSSRLTDLENELIGTDKIYTDVTNTGTTTVGSYLDTNGVSIVSNSSFNITEIDVTNCKGIKVYGYFGTALCALCFKDASNNIVGSINLVATGGYATFELDIPTGATKAFTSYLRDGKTFKQETYIYDSIINQLKENQNSEEERITDLENNVYGSEKTYTDVTNTATTTDGYYLAANGTTITALAGFKITEIDVTNCKGVRVNGYFSTSLCGLCFKDASNNIIGTIDVATASGYATFERDVPIGATKAFTSYSSIPGRPYKQETYVILSYENRLESLEIQRVGLNNWSGLTKLKRINMIPIFGQSLSVGAAATPAITTVQKYKAGLMFNGGILAAQKLASYFTSFQSLYEENHGYTVDSAGTGETVASGTIEGLLEEIQRITGLGVMSDFWDKHQFLFVSCGAGSTKISDLTANYYEGFKNAVQGSKNICDSLGYSLQVPAWIWIQGETDQKIENTSYSTYKSELAALAVQVDTDLKSITGQTNQVKCICYQTASQNIVSTVNHPTFSNTAMDIPTAQMELVRDNDYFIASSPVYPLEHSEVEPIHLNAISEKMLGFSCGIALANYLLFNYQRRGVTPTSYTIAGNQIDIIFNVQSPPLKFNSEWVKIVSNNGFSILKSDNTNIISSVSVFDNTVSIVCTESPLNAKLFYGFNGDSMFDGRIKGSRGNLCDSQNTKCLIANEEYHISNYSYSFAKLLDETSGNI